MGTLPVLSQYHLTGSFRLFQKEHPEISLALTEVEESELMEGIEKKRFAMILARESMIDTEHYHFFPIATDRICVMLPADHPLATRQKLSVTALTDQSFLLMHPYTSIYQLCMQIFQNAGIHPSILRTARVESLISAVAVGEGISLFAESNFRLMGAIAGAMSKNGKIGYIADYPIFGMTANINAFALGAKMVNPRAKVYLEWSTLKDHDVAKSFAENEVHYISGQDMTIPGEPSRHFGLYRDSENMPLNLAMPIWHWGKFYEQMIRNIMNGAWKNDDTGDSTKGLNYWWGMSAGIIDVICSQHLPIGTARLVDVLKKSICELNYNPFSGVLYSQSGIVQKNAAAVMDPEEIITMDWLAENVIGYIPKMEDLIEKAKPVVMLQGIDNPEI